MARTAWEKKKSSQIHSEPVEMRGWEPGHTIMERLCLLVCDQDVLLCFGFYGKYLSFAIFGLRGYGIRLTLTSVRFCSHLMEQHW